MVEVTESEEVSEEAFAYTPGLKIKKEMKVVKERRLPLLGEILVEKGDQVSHDTIVAKTEVPGDPELIKASNRLGVDEDEIEDFMLKKEGDRVKKGEIIGSYKMFFGLINREITSPIEGTIESISNITGQVILRPDPIPVEVDAYVPGKIIEVIPREGVVIETIAAFIQGILGISGETHGKLRIVTNSPEQELTEDKISEEDKGNILIGGSLITYDAFKKAIDCGVVGLVAGGINYGDLVNIMGEPIGVAITGEEKLGVTLIITEGFGKMKMSERTFELLQSFDGKMASINGATQIRAGVLRPEIIVPNPSDSEASIRSEEEIAAGMTSGTKVRIIREPYFGAIGTVINLPVELHTVETGSKVRVLTVKLEDEREVVVPRANVEILQE